MQERINGADGIFNHIVTDVILVIFRTTLKFGTNP